MKEIFLRRLPCPSFQTRAAPSGHVQMRFTEASLRICTFIETKASRLRMLLEGFLPANRVHTCLFNSSACSRHQQEVACQGNDAQNMFIWNHARLLRLEFLGTPEGSQHGFANQRMFLGTKMLHRIRCQELPFASMSRLVRVLIVVQGPWAQKSTLSEYSGWHH